MGGAFSRFVSNGNGSFVRKQLILAPHRRRPRWHQTRFETSCPPSAPIFVLVTRRAFACVYLPQRLAPGVEEDGVEQRTDVRNERVE